MMPTQEQVLRPILEVGAEGGTKSMAEVEQGVADRLGLASSVAEAIALAAVGCFGISSVIVLDGLRKDRTALK